ncbi:MAG: RNA polymerase subunit sigma-70 [Marivirga sp.]|nr:RNA polymerase subunit sigma-70 [Marivirga sp.]
MEKTFVDMINANRGIIYKVCNLYCLEKEYKQDLFQEIVLQLWKAFPSFRNESLRTTWMYRVALNTAISNFRKEIRKPERQSISRSEFQIPDISPFEDDHDNLSLLKQAIQQLSKIEKAIIMLYLDEKSYEEISDIMGITKSNIGVKINRIKTKLETIIKSRQHELR